MRRLFIAINLPENIKREIKNIISEIELDADAHWTPPENWHLTLTFLGYQPDEATTPILDALKETAALFPAPKLGFEKIILAPPGKPSRPPRMIWFAGAKETSKIIGQIKNNLENNLVKNGVKFKKESREYNAHITLARFPTLIRNYKNIQKYEKELLNYQITQLPISFTAQSLDLMESHLYPVRNRPAKGMATTALGRSVSNGVKRSGAEYEILSKLTFAQK